MQGNPGYRGIKAPRNLRHRYIFEDVPFSMVPLLSLGSQHGVDMQAVDAMVRLACVLHSTNYYERGRTAEDMGLKGLRVSEVKRYVQEGTIKPINAFSKRGNGDSRQRAALSVDRAETS